MAPPGSFLQRSRHGTVYYFRRRVPADLQALIGCLHLYATLETADRHEAVRRARVLAVRTDAWFESMRTDVTNGKKMTRKNALTFDWTISYSPKTKAMEFRPDASDTPEDTAVGMAAFTTAVDRMEGRAAVPASVVARPPAITLGRLVEEFLPTLKSSKTVRAYRTAFVHQFLPHFGADTDIQDVDQDAFAVWVKTYTPCLLPTTMSGLPSRL